VRALVCYLCVHQYLPIDRAAQLLADVLGASVATGTLATVVAEGAARLDGFVEVVGAGLAAAPVAHFDETGARVAGRLPWVHSASTPLLSLFTVHPKRGMVAMDAARVLPGFGGVVVHDGWAPYWRSPRLGMRCGQRICCGNWRQPPSCRAGLGRRAGRVVHHCPRQDQPRPRRRRRPARGHRPGGPHRPLRPHPRHRPRRQPPAATPPGRRRRRRRSPAACLLERLQAHRGEVLRFLEDLRVPPTNNLAERDIRMVKLQQKISGCWRTLDGAQAFLTVRSYISTAPKPGINPLAALRQLFQGDPWMPASAPP
jgi:transposase